MINPDSAESINLPQIRELLKSPNGSFRIIDKRRKVVRSDSGGAGETGESNERVVEDTVVPGKDTVIYTKQESIAGSIIQANGRLTCEVKRTDTAQ